MAEISSEEDSISIDAPSERFEKYGEAKRRAVYTSWPPPDTDSYPVWKRYSYLRTGVEGVLEFAASSDDESQESLGPVESILKEKWQDLADCKLEIYSIRVRLKNQRRRVRQARLDRDAADNDFMSLLRPLQPDHRASSVTLPVNIHQEFQKLQRMRDICQTYEVVLEKIEHDFKEAQTKMDLYQRRLIHALRELNYTRRSIHPHAMQTQPKPAVNPEPKPTQSELLMGLEIEPAHQSSALYQHLVATLRLITSKKNYLASLQARMVRLEDQQRQILMFKKLQPATLQQVPPLSDTDLEYMRTFATEERKNRADLANLQNEMKLVARLSWERNILPHEVPLDVVLGWYPEDFSIDADLGHSSEEAASTEPMDYSVLLSDTRHLLESFPTTANAFLETALGIPEGSPLRNMAITIAAKEVTIQTLLTDAKNTYDLINRWLLQNLRISRHEVGSLFSCHTRRDGAQIDDLDKWQWDVLRNWWDSSGQEGIRALFSEEHVGSVNLSGGSSGPPSWLSDPILVLGEEDDVSLPYFEMMEEQSDQSDRSYELDQESRTAFFSALASESPIIGHLPKASDRNEEGTQSLVDSHLQLDSNE